VKSTSPQWLSLYLPEAFEPLTDEDWDAARVRDRIGAVVVLDGWD
jgi:hypothetical protein